MRKPDLNSTLALIDKAKTIDELCAALHYFRERIEADHVAYRWVDGSGSFSDCSTLPLQWNDRYVTMGYHRIDPVISGCIAAFAPVDWRALDWSGRLAAGYRRDAIAFGVGNQGYSVPVRGPGGQFAVFSITKSCEDAEWDRILQGIARDLLLVAHYVNRRALEFERDFYALPEQPLSPRETEALKALAEGKSRAVAARELEISEHTLRVYIEGARGKLQAQNTTHAVARAISIGLIAP